MAFAMVLSGFFVSNSYAEAQAGQGVVFTMDVSDTPVMEITLKTTELYLSMTPQMASADFNTTDFEVTVGTSNKTGYNLNMTTSSTSLTRTEAISGETPVVQTLSTDVGVDDFTVNRWGYRKGLLTDENPTYSPILTTNKLSESEGPTNGITTDLVFAAKIDGTQPAGSYTTTLNFIATAKPTIPYLQNVDSTMCTTTASQAIDSRDNQVYTIKKLDDGKCWMMNNLNLGATELATNTQLDSTNTNIASGSTIDAATFNGWKKTRGSASYTAAEYIPITAENSKTGSATDPTSQTPYGTLYNYCAASAGTICTDSNSSNASYDLCPAGWRLPTGNKSGEFQALYGNSSYNTNAKMRAPESSNGAAFALAGRFDNAAPADQGSYGFYWSSTRYDDTYVYFLTLSTSNVDPADYSRRSYGLSIRCVLKDTRTPDDIQYLQDMNNDIAANMDSTKAYTLKDSRDDQEYTIKKLADGKVWMMTNLNLGAKTLTTDLTSSNTNLSNTVTAATFNGWKKSSGTGSYTAAEYIPITASNSYTGSATDPTSQTAYGTLYNYCAASAGTICTSSYSYNAPYDLCPAGWRLPTGGSSGEFQTLYSNSSYNSIAKMRAPESSNGAAFALAGLFYNAAPSSQGSYGFYWSSTRLDSAGMYSLRLNTSDVDPANNGNRNRGLSIRCVLK